jgi:hypothetical protein
MNHTPEPAPARGRSHQPGEDRFVVLHAQDIVWIPFAAYPPSVRMAVLVGAPLTPGPCVIRVKVPAGVKRPPHKHPEDRIYTVVSGAFYTELPWCAIGRRSHILPWRRASMCEISRAKRQTLSCVRSRLRGQEQPEFRLDSIAATVADEPRRPTAARLPLLLKQPQSTIMNVSSRLALRPQRRRHLPGKESRR